MDPNNKLAKCTVSGRTETGKAVPADLFGLTIHLLEVSRKITTRIIGSWRQPRFPVTRTSGSRPTPDFGVTGTMVQHGHLSKVLLIPCSTQSSERTCHSHSVSLLSDNSFCRKVESSLSSVGRFPMEVWKDFTYGKKNCATCSLRTFSSSSGLPFKQQKS